MLTTLTKAIITSKKNKKSKLDAYDEKVEKEKRDKKFLHIFSKNQTKAKIKTSSKNVTDGEDLQINGVIFKDAVKVVGTNLITDLNDDLNDTDNEQVLDSNSTHSSSDEELLGISPTNDILHRKNFLKSLFGNFNDKNRLICFVIVKKIIYSLIKFAK